MRVKGGNALHLLIRLTMVETSKNILQDEWLGWQTSKERYSTFHLTFEGLRQRPSRASQHSFSIALKPLIIHNSPE